MNIEAMLEDLEVMGYFETEPTTITKREKQLTSVIRVSFQDQSQPNLYLTMPLLGKDFVAGFERGSSRWLMIFSYSHLEELVPNSELQEISAKANVIIAKHLLATVVECCINPNQPIVRGKVTSLRQNNIQVQTEAGRNLWLLVPRLSYLAVEKLSIQNKI